MSRLTREQLISAALDLVDKNGADALSMRSLAARVDRQVSSLYNHVQSRADLIEAIRARIVAGIDMSFFADAPWDAAMTSWAESYLTAFAAHPNLIPLLATTPIRDASTLRMYEIVVGALRRARWPVRDAVAVMRTVEAHVLGSALDIVAPDDLLAQSSIPVELLALRAALDPALGDSAGAERAFRLGLAALLQGLRDAHRRATEAEASGASGSSGNG